MWCRYRKVNSFGPIRIRNTVFLWYKWDHLCVCVLVSLALRLSEVWQEKGDRNTQRTQTCTRASFIPRGWSQSQQPFLGLQSARQRLGAPHSNTGIYKYINMNEAGQLLQAWNVWLPHVQEHKEVECTEVRETALMHGETQKGSLAFRALESTELGHRGVWVLTKKEKEGKKGRKKEDRMCVLGC